MFSFLFFYLPICYIKVSQYLLWYMYKAFVLFKNVVIVFFLFCFEKTKYFRCIKGNKRERDNGSMSSMSIFILVDLCGFFYILDVWQSSGRDCTNLSTSIEKVVQTPTVCKSLRASFLSISTFPKMFKTAIDVVIC